MYLWYGFILTDQNTKTEEIIYRIDTALVETYRDRPYEFTVLSDLIAGKCDIGSSDIFYFLSIVPNMHTHMDKTYVKLRSHSENICMI